MLSIASGELGTLTPSLVTQNQRTTHLALTEPGSSQSFSQVEQRYTRRHDDWRVNRLEANNMAKWGKHAHLHGEHGGERESGVLVLVAGEGQGL